MAFVIGKGAFAAIDTTNGKVKRFRGEPTARSTLGFDNRCDVSRRGYMPNVDVYFVPTDGTETSFVHDGIREDLAKGTSLALPGPGVVHVGGIGLGDERAVTGYIATGEDDVRPVKMANAEIVDSRDGKIAAVALVEEGDASRIVLDAFPRRASYPVPAGRLTETWLDLSQNVMVAVLSAGDFKDQLCVFDLGDPTSSGACTPFAAPSPFFRMLVSDDGKRVVFTERIERPSKRKPRRVDDNDDRDDSSDECFLHSFDWRKKTDLRWRSPCSVTTEKPLRFEGDVVVTDGADVIDCSRSLFRFYDPKGRLLKTVPGPPPRSDVDQKLLEAIRKDPASGQEYLAKQTLWPKVYGHEELLTWSEHDHVLALDAGKLSLCTKRGATCAAITTVASPVLGGAALDVPILGAATPRRFVAVDARSGTTLLDVSLE